MASNSEFFERYNDPRWQRKRLEVMQRDNFRCRCCGSDTDTLNVHHAYYERDAMPWEYPDHVLVTLCKPCHDQKHHRKQNLLLILSYLDPNDTEKLMGYAIGIAVEVHGFGFTMLAQQAEGLADYFGSHCPANRDPFINALKSKDGKFIESKEVEDLGWEVYRQSSCQYDSALAFNG